MSSSLDLSINLDTSAEEKSEVSVVENAVEEVKITRKRKLIDIIMDSDSEEETETDLISIKYKMVYLYLKEWMKKIKMKTETKESSDIDKMDSELHELYVKMAISDFIKSIMNADAPDFNDILLAVSNVAAKQNIELSKKERIMSAKGLFSTIIGTLKEKRNEEFKMAINWDAYDNDSANESAELAEKLNANQAHWDNLTKIMDEFAKREVEEEEFITDDEESVGDE